MPTNQSVSQRLQESLKKIIDNAEPGQRLPSEPTLAKELGVSRATLREAMRTFETQGIIRRRQGSGTYVTHPPRIIESGLERLESIHTLAERTGLPVSISLLEFDRRAAKEEECDALELHGCEEVTSISRVVIAKDRPVAYLIDILPTDVLIQEELENGFEGSVLDYLLARGDPLMVSRTEINAVTASSKVARAMGIQRGDVLLCFIANLYTSAGRVIDHSYSYFLPGYFRFHVVRKVE